MIWKSGYQEAFGRLPLHYEEKDLISKVLNDLNIIDSSVFYHLIKDSIKYFNDSNYELKNHSFSKGYFGKFYIKTSITYIKETLYEKSGFIYPEDFKKFIELKLKILSRKNKMNRINEHS